jgi:hypothetical protein
MEKEIIKQINHNQTKKTDKWYRMFHNFGSELIDYRDQTIYIETNMSRARNWDKDIHSTTLLIANSYKKEPELADAKRYHNTVIKSLCSNDFGFVLSQEAVKNTELVTELLNNFNFQVSEDDMEKGIYEHIIVEGEY